MPRDAIIGARYEDSVFDSEFTIVGVWAETDAEIADSDEIVVEMDYDRFDDTTTVSLEQFRRDENIRVVDVPDHAG